MKSVKQNARFIISEDYTQRYPSESVDVILEINYINKSYSITPCNGHKEFKFLNTTSPEKWKALLNCMVQANELGAKELQS